jgi:hypothetical protein
MKGPDNVPPPTPEDDPPDLIWFLPVVFALGALFSGSIAIYLLVDDETRKEAGTSLIIPIGTLVVLLIRAVGYWNFLQQRKRAIRWLLAALFASAAFAIGEAVNLGLTEYLKHYNPIGLLIGYGFSIGVIVYAFELARKNILK